MWHLNSSTLVAIAFLLAALVTAAATPLARRLALRCDVVDTPGGRRIHMVPTPLWGGLAIIAGFLIALAALWSKLSQHSSSEAGDLTSSRLLYLAGGGLLIAFIGGVDDRHRISWRVRLLWQIGCAVLLFLGDIRISLISDPLQKGAIIFLPTWLGLLLAIIWVVMLTNAVNFIDGLDGLAAGVSAIAGLALTYIALRWHQPAVALIAAALAGAAVGFLPYNFHPAKIFMGDVGAYFLGFTFAGITILGAFKMAASIALFVPWLVLAFPLADFFLAPIRRYRNGLPIAKPDREHLHHKLLSLGLSQPQAVLLIYLVTLLSCLVAIWMARPG